MDDTHSDGTESGGRAAAGQHDGTTYVPFEDPATPREHTHSSSPGICYTSGAETDSIQDSTPKTKVNKKSEGPQHSHTLSQALMQQQLSPTGITQEPKHKCRQRRRPKEPSTCDGTAAITPNGTDADAVVSPGGSSASSGLARALMRLQARRRTPPPAPTTREKADAKGEESPTKDRTHWFASVRFCANSSGASTGSQVDPLHLPPPGESWTHPNQNFPRMPRAYPTFCPKKVIVPE